MDFDIQVLTSFFFPFPFHASKESEIPDCYLCCSTDVNPNATTTTTSQSKSTSPTLPADIVSTQKKRKRGGPGILWLVGGDTVQGLGEKSGCVVALSVCGAHVKAAYCTAMTTTAVLTYFKLESEF